MHFEALKYLYDMEQACVLLSSFLVGKTFADYEADPMLRSAVERQLMIVGEALNRLRKTSMKIWMRTKVLTIRIKAGSVDDLNVPLGFSLS